LFVAYQPRDAAASLVEALNAITDCVTAQRLFATPKGDEPDVLYSVKFGRVAQPVPLRAKAGGSSGLMLDVLHSFVLIGSEQAGAGAIWRAVSTAYEYRILDAREAELLVFHWHPGSVARGPDFQHLHVSAALSAQVSATIVHRLPLDKRHVPTGLVTLADVVRMLIAEFGIAERRRDWPARLARAEATLRRTTSAGA
jgi:hypothetical protein